jgi:hypothetical protein
MRDPAGHHPPPAIGIGQCREGDRGSVTIITTATTEAQAVAPDLTTSTMSTLGRRLASVTAMS